MGIQILQDLCSSLNQTFSLQKRRHRQWPLLVNTLLAPPPPQLLGRHSPIETWVHFVSLLFSYQSQRERLGPGKVAQLSLTSSIPGPASHICKLSEYHLIGAFEPAEEKVLLNCSIGRAEFIQMGELAETTEQIPATNPFHTSEKRERNGRGQAKAKQALENLKLWAEFLSCSRSPNTQFRELGPLRKRKLSPFTPLRFSLLQKKGKFVPNHKIRIVSCTIISTVILESAFVFLFFLVVVGAGLIQRYYFFQRILCCWDLSLSLWHASILVFIFSCLSLSFFPLFFQERKLFSFFFFLPEYAKT